MALPLLSLAMRAGIPAARAGLRFLSNLKKPSRPGITLFRGEPAKPFMSLKDQAKHMYGRKESLFYGKNPLREAAAGRWFSSQPTDGLGYGGHKVYSLKPSNWANIKNWGGGYAPGVIKRVTVSPKELKLAKRLQQKVSGGDMQDFYIIPRSTLPRVEKDAILTAVANLKRMMGLKHGGLARILEV